MAHVHELIDFTIGALIIHPAKDKVLLVNHPRYNRWLCVGGHIELDEDPNQALLREVQEECGLAVEVVAERPEVPGLPPTQRMLWQPRFVDIHDANAPHQHISLTYVCLAKSADFTVSDEHDEAKWFTLEELTALGEAVPETVKYYARTALEEVQRGE